MSSQKRLNAASDTALHQQLYALLKERIESGVMTAGQKLPSERQLAAENGISRTTARQALKWLAAEGFIYSRPGSGSYVAVPNTTPHLNLRDFSEQMQLDGLPHATRLIQEQILRADTSLARNLNLSEGEKVVVLKHLRLIHTTPIGIETAYLPLTLFPDLLQLNPISLYQTLESHYGLRLTYGTQTIQAQLASPDECEHLESDPPLAVLVIRRRAFDSHQKVLIYSISIFKGDRYPLNMTLRRE